MRDRAIKEKYLKFSNDVISVMSSVFREAVEDGRMAENVALGVRRLYKPSKQANRAWDRGEWSKFIEIVPSHLKLPLSIARWAGLRGIDIAALRWSSYRPDPEMGKVIVFEATKNGNRVSIGVLPRLKSLLDNTERRTLTICSNSLGKPYPSENALRKAWQDFKASRLFTEALPHSADLTLHGLRVTYASMVKEAGFDNQAIADAIGDNSESMGKHYSRGAAKRHNTLRIFKALSDQN